MNAVRIAVVVPNYNHSQFISRCIGSILSQDVLPDEIVIVDDKSTDHSLEIIKKLTFGISNLKVISNPKNLGVYGAIDVGADSTTSEYIMFVASNDFLMPGIIKHAKSSINQYQGVGLWSAMGYMVNEEDKYIKPIRLAVPSLKERYFTPVQCKSLANELGNWFAGPSVIYNKNTWKTFGKFESKFKGFADLLSALMVASYGGAIFTPHYYVGFRVHNNSYLAGTVSDPKKMLTILQDIKNEVPTLCPFLFDPILISKTLERLIFSSMNASNNFDPSEYISVLNYKKYFALLTLNRYIFSKKLKAILSFLILRPYDIWPSLYRRYLLFNMIKINKF